MQRQVSILSLSILVALVFAACSAPQVTTIPADARPAPSSGAIVVTVSILPQQYFLERVGGQRVQVNVMVPPGGNPHTYEPKPEQLRELSRSAAYFTIGVEFESAWMERIAGVNLDMIIVDTTAGIERLPLETEHHHEGEEHDEEDEIDNPDPHIWLSPTLVKVQVENIYRALAKIDPDHRDEYRANADEFMEDIDALDAEIRSALSGVQERQFMVFHPSWGYFAHDYDLEQLAIEVGGQEPSAAEMARLIDEAREHNVKVIFAQPSFSTRAAEAIASEIGGKVLLIDPLALDWLDNMKTVAATLAETLGGRGE